MSASLMTIGLMLKAYDNMSSVVSLASSKSIASLSQVQEKLKTLSSHAEQFGRAALANGMVAAGAAIKPLQSFAELEDATTDLKVAMMDNLGKVPSQFEAISKQAVELGNLLPGTTADFVGAGRALIEQGTGFDTILNGGLRSASYLSVLLKMPAREAAEMVAKLREAYGLADNELEKMADMTQRARFAFGMTPQDIKIASSYSGATQNILGLTGLDNAKKLLAMQGLGAGVSLEGSSWGTNFSMLLTRTAESKDRLARNSKEMKAINEDMKAYGINLQFFDGKGAFMGLDNMVKQFEKTNIMSQVDQINLFKKLFGAEAGRPAAIIANKGYAGYLEAQEKMERQASMQQRIEVALGTIKNKWEALTGTVTNGLAAIGGPIAEFVAPAIMAMNDFVGGPMMAFIEQHKTLVGVIGTSVLVVGLLAAALGALGLVAGTVGKFIGGGIGAIRGMAAASRFAIGWLATHRLEILRLMGVQRAQIALRSLQNAITYRGGVWQALQYALLTTKYRILGTITAGQEWMKTASAWTRTNVLSLGGLRGLAGAFAGPFITGIRGAILAVRAFSLALLTNPIGLVVALIAGAALLIYKYWKPIKAFFSGVWEGLKAGLAPLMPALRQLGKAAIAALLPIVMPVVLIWKWLSRLFDYIKSTSAFRQFAKWAGGALSSIFAPLKTVWNWLSHIFDQVEDTGGAARNMGVAVGQGIAHAILWVGKLGKTIFELPGKFFDTGVAIAQGLWRGIESMAAKPVEAIQQIGSEIAGAFKRLLGIQSPSRVFMGFGDNIGQGAALGIESSLPRVRKAIDGLAGPALGAAHAGPVAVGPVRLPSAAGGAGAAAGAVTMHFSPVINVSGGDVGGQVKSALADGYREFEANMRRFMAERQRGGF